MSDPDATSPHAGPEPSCRLFAILARRTLAAVVLRRGPSGHVLCVRWDRARDAFEEGQWLKGRIYERRCDLSPSGTYLLYFAAKWGTPMATWTAISRPPHLTALALWPKGDAWGGGGMFEDERSIVLNSPYVVPKLTQGGLAPKMRVRELGLFGRGGEDFPLYGMRLERDGWRCVSPGKKSAERWGESPWITFDPAIEYARPRPHDPGCELRMRITGIKEQGGDWWIVEHAVVGSLEHDLGRTEWADWDANGDLLFAREGVLFRARDPGREPRVLVDLRDRRFVPRQAPPRATKW